LVRAVKDERPDLIYERYALGNVAGVLVARRFSIPIISEVNAPLAWERSRYGGLTFPGVARRLEKWVLERSDRVIAVTEVMRRILIEEGADPSRTIVVPNGVDLAAFEGVISKEDAKERLGLSGRTVLGFTGFCREWHGLDRVVSLLGRREGPLERAHFLIVGDGPVRGSLLRQAETCGVEKRVTLTGVVAREKLCDYIAAFDVALQPAVVGYASPLKLFEYMAMRLCVVAPDKANIREVVKDGETAILFDEDDDRAFEQAVLRALSDDAARDRIGRAARHEVEVRPLTWDRNAEVVDELYASIRMQDGGAR
jgi:glycosyltransferase involved in cell wall biosynthesis